MNVSSDECRTLFSKMYLLDTTNINILISTNILVSISNVMVNALVILLIYKTKQYQNSSLRLTLYMSISDFMVGLVSQHMMTVFLFKSKDELSCTVQVLMQYILYIFPHITGFFVGLVALDRYCRVKYTHKYPEVMTFKRQTIGLITIIILAILNCMVLISGIFTGNWVIALVGIQPLDNLFVLCDVSLYWRAIVLMKQHVKGNTVDLKMFSKSISRLASIYLVLVIIFYPPYLLLDLVQAFVDSSNTTVVFWHVMTLIWVFMNSVVNAVSFLVVNRKARSYLNQWKNTLFCCRENTENKYKMNSIRRRSNNNNNKYNNNNNLIIQNALVEESQNKLSPTHTLWTSIHET